MDNDEALVQAFCKRLNQLLDIRLQPHQMTARMRYLASCLGVSEQAARKWVKGIALPSPVMLVTIAAFFSVTIDWLLGLAENSGITDVTRIPCVKLDGRTNSMLPWTTIYYQKRPSDGDMPEVIGVKNWCDLIDPPLRRSDTVMVDIGALSFRNDGIYLVRKGDIYSWRRVTIPLSGDIIHFSHHLDGVSEKSIESVKRDSIDFDGDLGINARASADKLLISGHAVAVNRTFDPSVPFL